MTKPGSPSREHERSAFFTLPAFLARTALLFMALGVAESVFEFRFLPAGLLEVGLVMAFASSSIAAWSHMSLARKLIVCIFSAPLAAVGILLIIGVVDRASPVRVGVFLFALPALFARPRRPMRRR